MFHLFHEELLDYGQEKFTQGFGDGYKKGREEMQQKLNESQEFWTKYNEQMQPLKLDWQVDLHEVLDLRKDAKGIPHFFIGGKKVEGAQLQELKAEAITWLKSGLWSIIMETIKQKALEKATIESTQWEHTLAGKMMLHDLGLIRSIVEGLEKITTE